MRHYPTPLFTVNDAGVWRPSGVLLPQMCFVVYSAMTIISLFATAELNPAPTWAIVFQQFSTLPLGLAIHTIFYASFLAPTTKVLLRAPNSSMRTSKFVNEQFNWAVRTFGPKLIVLFFGIVVPVTFVALAIFATVLAGTVCQEMLDCLEMLFQRAEEIDREGLGLSGVVTKLQPVFLRLAKIERDHIRDVEIGAGIYLFFIVGWLLLYIPSAISMDATLRHQRSRIKRSIRNLQVLDDLVTSVGHAEDDERSPNHVGVQTNASNNFPLTPSSPSSSNELKSARRSSDANTVRGPQVVRTTGRRSGSRLEELDIALAKTEKLLHAVEVQLAFVIVMGVTELAADCYTISLIAGIADSRYQFIVRTWALYAFAVPCFIASASFFTSALGLGIPPATESSPTVAQNELHGEDTTDLPFPKAALIRKSSRTLSSKPGRIWKRSPPPLAGIPSITGAATNSTLPALRPTPASTDESDNNEIAPEKGRGWGDEESIEEGWTTSPLTQNLKWRPSEWARKEQQDPEQS